MAKDVITRFKLETTQYDSKIKNAAKELSDVAKSAKSAGADFERFTKDSLEAARSLGNIATSSTNAKDRAKELVGAFNDVARSYNQLTEEQKKSDFGKALSQSLTQLQQRIRDTKEEMKGLESGGGLFGGGKLDGMLQVFGGNLMTKAAGFAAGLASEMGDMIQQGIELAKQGEGIRIAFDRLGRGDILDGLREATHGTVTDLELMKAAVKFNDFKLPLEELGTMLAFAQQKAKDTGQSVDYMVDSIVTGLGRKSLMILDNLGLSAAEIKERMKETGDMTKAVGAIIRDQMAAAGDYVETAADRAAQANVSLQNKMEELGRKFGPVEEASNQLWTSMKIGILDIIGGPLATLLNQLTEAGRLKNALNDINGDGSSGNTVVGGKLKQLQAAKNSGASQYMLNSMQSGTIEGWNRQIMKADELLKQFEKNHSSVNVVLQNATKQFGQKFSSISELEAFRDAYKVMVSDYRKGASEIMKHVNVNINTQQSETNIKKLRQQLKELEEQRKKAVKAGDQEQVESLTKQISQTKTNLGYLDPRANKTGSSSKTAQAELQENQAKINALTQEYVKLGDESTEAARERQAEIQKEIELLKERNGLLGLRAEQAQGRFLVGAGDFQKEGLKNVSGFGLLDKATNFGKNIEIPSGGLQLSDKLMGIVEKNIENSLPKNDKKEKKGPMDDTKKVVSGLNQVASGLQQMGIELPEGVNQVLGVVNGLMSILQGINTVIGVTQFAAITANTVSLDLLTAAIWANTASSFIPFAGGGIVGFAKGGLIGKAASGMLIGNHMSGDNLRLPVNGGGFIGVNDGELILNRAQQGVLADALEGGGIGNLGLSVKVTAEELRFILGNNSRRRGKGEYVTSTRLR